MDPRLIHGHFLFQFPHKILKCGENSAYMPDYHQKARFGSTIHIYTKDSSISMLVTNASLTVT